MSDEHQISDLTERYSKEDYTTAAQKSAQEHLLDAPLIRTPFIHQTQKDRGINDYGQAALKIVAHCKNAGIPAKTNAIGMTGKSKRSTIAVQIFAEINPQTHTIVHAGFKAHGCIAMIACASVATSLIVNKTVDEALSIPLDAIVKEVGRIPADKIFTYHLAHEAIRSCMGDYLIKQGFNSAEVRAKTSCSERIPSCHICEDCSLRVRLLEEIAAQTPRLKRY